MCPQDNELHDQKESPELSATGSKDSNGVTGEPSPSEELSGRMVRHHKGLITISTGLLTRHEECPATFIALSLEDSDAYMVTLSCVLTSIQYGQIVSSLSMPGVTGSVAAKFEPMTPNLVPQDIVPNI